MGRQMLVDHERLCGERFGEIRRQLGFIIKVGGWAGATIAFVVLGSLGYLAKAQIDNTQHQITEMHVSADHVIKQVKEAP